MPIIKTLPLTIGDREIKCIIKSNRRSRTVSLRISQLGELILLTPFRFPLREAENILRSNLPLVQKELEKFNSPVRKLQLFGEPIRIVTKPGRYKTRYRYTFSDNVFTIELHPSLNVTQDQIYDEFLKIQTREVILPLAEALARKYGFEPKKLKIGRGTTRWGSCSTSGIVSLNFLLAALPKDIIEYVIIHEFCHLRYMNHSQAFWQEVAKYVPDYKLLRRKLKGKID